MSQQDAAKEQANTRNNLRVVSVFAAAAIAVSRSGTSESCPSRAEIRDLIRTLETEKP